MATEYGQSIEQQIQQQREAISAAKAEVSPVYTKRRQYTPRAEREQRRQVGEQISTAETQFESQIAQQAPELAKTEYRQSALNEATNYFKNKISQVENKIKERLDKITYYELKRQQAKTHADKENYDNKINDVQDEISILNKEKKGYNESLGDSNKTIKYYYSGYGDKLADYYSTKESSRIDARNQFREMKMSGKLDTTLQQLNLPKTVSLSEFNKAVKQFNEGVSRPSTEVFIGGLGYSVPVDKQQDFIQKNIQSQMLSGEKIIFSGTQVTGIESSLFGKTMNLEEYQKQLKYLEDNAPQIKYVDVTKYPDFYTGKFKYEEKAPQLGAGAFLVQDKNYQRVYVDPQTQKPIENIQDYLASKNLPQVFPEKIQNIKQLIASASAKPAYDIARLSQEVSKDKLASTYWRETPQVGTVTPITPMDVITATVAVASAGQSATALKAAGYLGSAVYGKQITGLSSYLTSKIPTGNIPVISSALKGIKGFGEGMVIRRVPILGVAYASSLVQDLVKSPKATAKSFAESLKQPETIGMLLGGSRTVTSYAEAGIRRLAGQPMFKVTTENIPGYGAAKVIESSKYGRIVYLEGEFAQSEKLRILDQLEMTNKPGRVVFVQGSPKAIEMAKLAEGRGKGVGFEVIEVGKPLRGFYEAPPIKFLRDAFKDIKTESGLLTHYLEAGGRSRLLVPTPSEIRKLIEGEVVLKESRPSVQLRRAAYPKTQKWIYETAKAIERGVEIPKEYMRTVNYYYSRFLKEPYKFGEKIYEGKEKVDLVNTKNLRGRGSGLKLKVYSALLQFQKETKAQLIGGAEVLSGVSPFGPESQLVSGLGTRFYRRSLEDLRKAKKISTTEKVTTFLTRTRRGQAFAIVGGGLLEFEYVRAYPGKIKGAFNLVKEEAKGAAEKATAGAERARRVATEQRRLPSIPKSALVRAREEVRRTQARVSRIERLPTDFFRARPTTTRAQARPITRPAVTRAARPELRVRELPTVRDFRFSKMQSTVRPTKTASSTRPPMLPGIFQRRKEEPRQKKKVTEKEKKKGRAYQLTPTLSQRTVGVKRAKPLLLSAVTGFEIARV